jgi:hypothetical protein
MLIDFCYIVRKDKKIFVAENRVVETDNILNNINASVSENNNGHTPMVMCRTYQTNVYPQNEAEDFARNLVNKNSEFKA